MKYIIILFFASLSLTTLAQNINIDAKLDKHQIKLGEQAVLSIEVKQPKSEVLKFPVLIAGDTLVDGVEIIKQSGVDTSKTENGNWLIKQQWTITSFDSGRYQLKPLPFLLKKQSSIDTMYSRSLELYAVNAVDFSEIDTAKRMDKQLNIIDVKPIKEKPFSLKAFFKEYLWFFILGLLIIAAIVYYFVISKKGKTPVFTKPKPKIPPHEIALKDLKELEEKKLWQKNEFKLYHSELTEIIREYIEERFDFPALERTSIEILTAFENTGKIDGEKTEWLKQIFTVADFVKFAKLKPGIDENERNMEYAYKFVNSTRPKPVTDEIQEVKKAES